MARSSFLRSIFAGALAGALLLNLGLAAPLLLAAALTGVVAALGHGLLYVPVASAAPE